ncbi:MAG TPA: glycosyltransferase, partial [Solirubrobacteraceae bacterium]
MTVVAVLFWVSAGLLVYAQVGYALLLVALAPLKRRRRPPVPDERPDVTVVVAAYAEEAVIARRVENLRNLDYPAANLEVIVACDGATDATAQRARAAGADQVLELPRGGKIRAQDAGVRAARGELVAFSDANATWAPDALTHLVAAFADPRT